MNDEICHFFKQGRCRYGNNCSKLHINICELLDPPTWIFSHVDNLKLNVISMEEVRYSLKNNDTRRILDDMWIENYTEMYTVLNSLCRKGPLKSASKRCVDLRKTPSCFNLPFDTEYVESKILRLMELNPISDAFKIISGDENDALSDLDVENAPSFVKEYAYKKEAEEISYEINRSTSRDQKSNRGDQEGNRYQERGNFRDNSRDINYQEKNYKPRDINYQEKNYKPRDTNYQEKNYKSRDTNYQEKNYKPRDTNYKEKNYKQRDTNYKEKNYKPRDTNYYSRELEYHTNELNQHDSNYKPKYVNYQGRNQNYQGRNQSYQGRDSINSQRNQNQGRDWNKLATSPFTSQDRRNDNDNRNSNNDNDRMNDNITDIKKNNNDFRKKDDGKDFNYKDVPYSHR